MTGEPCVTPVGDLILAAAEQGGTRPAIVFPEGLSTYGELAVEARMTARSLAAMGVKSGDRVGIFMPNCPEFIEVFFGIVLLGAVAVPINARFRAHELRDVIRDSGIAHILTTSRGRPKVDFPERLRHALSLDKSAVRRHGSISALVDEGRIVVIVFGEETHSDSVGEKDFKSLSKRTAIDYVDTVRKRVRVRDVALIMYTSGTADRPKGALLTHEALVRSAHAAAIALDIGEATAVWAPHPFFHIGALMPLLAVFSQGARFLAMQHFDAGKALDFMERESATIALAYFPTIYQDLIGHSSFRRTDLGQLHTIVATGPEGLRRRLQNLLPNTVQIGGYGSTETCGFFCLNERDESADVRARTCGRPFPGVEVRIQSVDMQSPVVGPDIGEIQVRGYCVFEGYYRDAERTATTITTDGWLRTGDIGFLDDVGRIVFVDRSKDMLKVGGENVSAVEVEACIMEHSAVVMAQVVGIPDDRLVELPAAFVEVERGTVVSEAELIEFCASRLASFKVPRQIKFVTKWPMSATKIQKNALRARLLSEMGRST